MSFKISVDGLADIRDELTRIGAIAGQKTMARAARKAMQPVYDEAVSLVPVKTGKLRASLRIASTVRVKGQLVAAAGIKIGKEKIDGEIPYWSMEHFEAVAESKRKAWYWHIIELGSVKYPPHPFLRPAFQNNTSKMIEIFKTYCQKAIDRALKHQDPDA